jgi:antitoxin component YwqK of YwqJK toxin-antitoxin module
MSKKIQTIQSSDKKKFDEQINSFLELGCELHNRGYEVIEKKEEVIYSQVIVIDTNKCFVEYYDNGEISHLCNLNVDGEKDGKWTEWFSSGQKWRQQTYKDDEIGELLTEWFPNGQKMKENHYKDGDWDGLWTTWYMNGQKSSEITYKRGNYCSHRTWNEDGSLME